MSIPKVNPSRLQRVVNNIEFENDITFDELCEAVASDQYAQNMEIDSQAAGTLIIHHNTITVCEKPDKWPLVDGADSESVNENTESPVPDLEPQPVAKPKLSDTPGKQIGDPEVVAKLITTFDEGGKGRKQCPSCSKYIAARNMVCACGHKFEKKAPAKKGEPKADKQEPKPKPEKPEPHRTTFADAMVDRRLLRITTPAGACPVKLESTEYPDVVEWAEKVRDKGEENNRFYLLRALMYFVREFYSIHQQEYSVVCDHLRTAFPDEMKVA